MADDYDPRAGASPWGAERADTESGGPKRVQTRGAFNPRKESRNILTDKGEIIRKFPQGSRRIPIETRNTDAPGRGTE